MKEKISRWYRLGLWNKEMVMSAADKGILTKAEAEALVNG